MSAAALVELAEVDSTQDVLHQLAADGAAAGTAVVAQVQRGGRGSRGRSWQSPAGGLWVSVLCRPAGGAAVDVLSLRVGLGLAAAVEQEAPGAAIGLKWPNDLMLGDRKLGGILCEARWQGGQVAWVAVGVGLNVRNPIPETLVTQAAALAEVAPGLTPGLLRGAVIGAVTAAGTAAGHMSQAELAAWRARDWLRDRELLAPIAGWSLGPAADGQLQVRTPAGAVESLRSGTVTWRA